MRKTHNKNAPFRLRNWLRADVNGLFVVLGLLLAVLLLLPAPTEAEFRAGDVQMNDIIRADDMKR